MLDASHWCRALLHLHNSKQERGCCGHPATGSYMQFALVAAASLIQPRLLNKKDKRYVLDDAERGRHTLLTAELHIQLVQHPATGSRQGCPHLDQALVTQQALARCDSFRGLANVLASAAHSQCPVLARAVLLLVGAAGIVWQLERGTARRNNIFWSELIKLSRVVPAETQKQTAGGDAGGICC